MSERARSRKPAATGGAAGRRARPETAAAARRPAPKRRTSTFDRAVAILPVSKEALKKAGNWMLGAGITGAIIAGIVAMGLPQMAWAATALAIGDAGFSVRNVEILNRRRADAGVVYDIAMSQKSRAMPLVDLEGTRAELMKLGWIADARISRRMPDTLVVDIVERVPAAIWQYQHRLALIDKDGVVIAPVDDRAMPDLPVVVGPGANMQADELSALLAGVPQLKPLITAASWQGQRRWDIIFQSGEKLMLPEGEAEAKKALDYFARQDRTAGLLGKGLVSIDLRDPARAIVRMSREPGSKIETPKIGVGAPSAPALAAKTVA
jgi:cell division protein FtsQ